MWPEPAGKMRIGRFVSSDPDADKVVEDDKSVVDAVVVVLSSEGAAGDVDDSDGSDMVIVWLWR